MKKLFVCTFLAALFALDARAAEEVKNAGKKTEVVMIYYPRWQKDPHEQSWYGLGWTEYEFMKDTKPHFEGHRQPKFPNMKLLDSANPEDVAKEIDLAADNGIDVFLYCWYYYCGVRNLEAGLDKGFLGASNNGKIKFAVMWANHTRNMFFPAKFEDCKPMPMLTIRHSQEDTLKVVDFWIDNYFKQPNYWKVNGEYYVSIFVPDEFIKQQGGVENVKKVFALADEKMKKAGLGKIHWAAKVLNLDQAKEAAAAGFKSTFRYNISPLSASIMLDRKSEWINDYSIVAEASQMFRRKLLAYSPIPNLTVVTSGWDITPRCNQEEKFPYPKNFYPYTSVLINNTADAIKEELEDAKKIAELGKDDVSRAVLINAWNEWCEGSYILPERREAMAPLRAISEVFGKPNPYILTYADPYGPTLVTIPAPTYARVKYGEHTKQYIDFWKCKSDKPAPTVIYVHGGAWTSGANLDMRLKQIIKLLDKGYNVASVEYRFIEDAEIEHIFPPVKAPMEDTANAVKFILNNSKEWNIDPSRVALMGGSAGACASLWAALSGEAKVKMVSVYVPQTSLDPKQMLEWDSGITYGGHAFGKPSFYTFIKSRNELMGEIKKYSPYERITKNAPAIYMTFADAPNMGKTCKDPTHSPNFGPEFKAKCDSLGVKCAVTYDSNLNNAVSNAIKDIEKNL